MPVRTVRLGVTRDTATLVALIAERTGEQPWQVARRLVDEEITRMENDGRIARIDVRTRLLQAAARP